MTNAAPPPVPSPAPDPFSLLKSRSYVVLLVLGAVIGVPVATVAYFFLDAVSKVQTEIYQDSSGEPRVPRRTAVVAGCPGSRFSGFLVALTLRYLPGTGGHEPSEGFKTGGGPVAPIDLFGVIAAAFATLSLGVVLGPEAPLIAIGSGLGVLAVHLVKKDAPPMAAVVIGGAGGFAAIATLLGSPLTGAFLLMEAIGWAGRHWTSCCCRPALGRRGGRSSSSGSTTWTGFGKFSLEHQPEHSPRRDRPPEQSSSGPSGIGLAAAVLVDQHLPGSRARQARGRGAAGCCSRLSVGLAIGGLAIAFAQGTGRSSSDVLFSGQSALPDLVQHAATWSAGALVMLVVCKAVA